MIGTYLQNRYRLDAELGQGGMGSVYRAYDTVLDRPVPTERLKFYQAADRLLVDEALIMPLLHTRHHYLLKPWLKRFPITPLKASYWKDVVIEPH